MTAKKRGRPAKTVPVTTVSDFQKTLNEWDAKEREVDFKELCQKLQEALAKSYCDYEVLERNVALLRDEITCRDIIIRYLENRAK